MKRPLTFHFRSRISFFAACLACAGGLLSAHLFLPEAQARVSARYGYQLNATKYRTSLPINSRLVFVGNRRLYLADGIYYEPYMYNGRIIYVPVDRTFQR